MVRQACGLSRLLSRRHLLRAGAHGALLAGLGLAAACSKPPEDLSAEDLSADDVPAGERTPGVLIRLGSDEVQSLDQHKVSTVEDVRVALELFEGLVRYRADGTPEPGLAESWIVSDDGLLWTFTLREGLRFSDDAPLTAADVVASFRRLMTPSTVAPNANLFHAIQNAPAIAAGKAAPEQLGVRALDARTVEIRLTRPFPAFLELLAHAAAAVLPAHVLNTHGDGWVKQRPLIGSGPFRLKAWRLHSVLRLERNPAYHDAANVALAGVEYRPVQDDQTALRLFRAKAADVLTDFPARDLPLLRRTVPDAIRIAPYRGTYYFAFNMRRPPFDDVRVRRALAMSVDREILVNKVIGLGQPIAWSVVPPHLAGYGPAVLPGYARGPQEQRLAEARRLLAEAGYGPDCPLEFTIRYNTDVEHRRVALALAQMWKPLGVVARIGNAEAAVHFAALRTGDFTLARSGWIADYSGAENFLSVYLSDAGPLNYPGYDEPQYDSQVREALGLADPAARLDALRKAESLLVEDVPVLPLYHYVSKSLVGPDVEGWTDNLANIHPSRTLRLKAAGSTAADMTAAEARP